MDQVTVGAGINPTMGNRFKKGRAMIDLLRCQPVKHGLRSSHFHVLMFFFACG
jgi:hypothetical protein